jgi:PAS domain S-box-containing protein
VYSREGEVAYRLAMLEELTESEVSSARRRADEQRFRLVVEAAPNAMILVDAAGRITMLNYQTERLFGYARDDLLGQPVEILFPLRARSHASVRSMLGADLKSLALAPGNQLFGLRRDGSEIPVEIGLSALVTLEGTQVLASIIDISERWRAEERFRMVVEAAPNAMVLVGRLGLIGLVNTQTELLFGYAREELVGRPMEMLLPHRFRGAHHAQRTGYLEDPRARSMGAGRELFGLRKDGTEVPIEIGLNPMETAEGTQVLASIIDITERKHTDTERANYTNELRRSNDDLDQFAYVASHDLVAPLRAIQNLAGWISKDAAEVLPEQSQRHLQLLISRTRRLEKLLADLLTFSRAGRMLGELDEVDLAELLNEAVELLAPRAGFQVRATTPLPVIRSYRAPLREIFINLIGNAIKHHDRDAGEIAVAFCRSGDRYICTVTDDGPGIPRQYHQHVFGMFQTLKARDDVEGSGMGLTFVKKLIESQGGAVEILDTGGRRGTSVCCSWPVPGEIIRSDDRRRTNARRRGAKSKEAK